ncbi:retroviral-like aspartic protease family protein [Chryseobacterium soli]|uniref:retropepsin-like aspartic protease n=1 Tax=Chryseobacterium soli TaxID=445961 RepID=UPI002953B25B|nr:retropepsin-like aspartic protease [Chryseobacterium soli]MDV7696209.1 retroviral-like aspartic protease family protein [Chryseobacterium soli]
MKFMYLITVFITTSVSAQKKPTVIPFSLEDHSVYIYAKVNKTDSIKFLFDTGADGSVINSSSKKKIDLKIQGTSQNQGSNGTNTVDTSINNMIQFGNIEKKNVTLTLIPYETNHFDGVFGIDLMKGNIVEIDYNTKEIRFYEPNDNTIDYSGYEKMKLQLVDNYPAVESSFTTNGKTYSGLFGLDSGADDALTIAAPFAKKNTLATLMKKIGKATAQGSDGSVYEMPVVLCPSINFAQKYLYNIPVTLSASTEGIDATEKMAGFFGNKFLKRFNMIIDFNNQLIYFKLNRNLYSEF